MTTPVTNNMSNQDLASPSGDIIALLAIVAIVIVAGIIGGVAAHMAEPKADANASIEPPRTALKRFLILGVVAAACVPLFLSLLQSALLRKVLEGRLTAEALESYLIFTGLCLVAAFSARRFIDSVTEQVLRKADQAQRDAAEAQARSLEASRMAQDAHETAVEAVNEVESVDSREDASPLHNVAMAANEVIDPTPVSAVERKALEALRKKTYRTRTGIAEESGIAKSRISEVLESLAERKLALPTRSPTTGGARWIITDRGLAALDSDG